MACPCGCGFDTVDAETLKLADECRWYVGHPIKPSSVCRCESHNKTVGGSPQSQHLLGRAMDLPVNTPQALYGYLCEKYRGKYGFGLYSTFVHIDTKTGPARRWVIE